MSRLPLSFPVVAWLRIGAAFLAGLSFAFRASAAADANVGAKTYNSGSKTFEATHNLTVTGAVIVNNTATLVLDAGNAIAFGPSGSLTANSGATVLFQADNAITTSERPVVINGGATVAFESLGTITLGPGFHATAASGSGFHASIPVNNARYVGQEVPALLNPGENRQVSLTFMNSGGTWWRTGDQYRLGSVGDNAVWGLTRVALNGDVSPGQTRTFGFNIKAPATYGTYRFQWKMVQDGVEWFGGASPEVLVEVAHWGFDATASHLLQPSQSHLQGEAGAFNSEPFVVTIRDAATHALVPGASVLVMVASGSGKLAAGNTAGATLADSLTLQAGAEGVVRFYYKHPAGAAATAVIYVITSGGSVVVTTSSRSSTGADADTNGNGLSDAMENALGIAAGRPVQVVGQSGTVNLSIFTP
ncbi:hypothetical protein OpiT1DRAFT_03311 [Opitutaceae bacterium TAV1]|nr:hypothetical protein OpiT1DRAFT_03311 [Opitutaceae bacterium TAV1]